jgi:hypothetical protein
LGFVKTASFAVGIFCFFAAAIRYVQHRTNPMMAPLSSVVLLMLLGLVLVLWPHVDLLIQNLPDFLR